MIDNSPYKIMGTDTFSIPTNSPDKQSSFSNKPFDFISQNTQYQQSSYPPFPHISHHGNNQNNYHQANGQQLDEQGVNYQFNNQYGKRVEGTRNKSKFQTHDLYRNPMLESIDGDFPQLIESQTVEHQHPLPYHYPNNIYTKSYATHQSGNQVLQSYEDRDKHYRSHQNEIDFSPQKGRMSHKDLNIQSHNKIQTPPESKNSQNYIKTQSNLLEDHDYDNWGLNVGQNNRRQTLNQENEVQNNEWEYQKFSDKSEHLQILSKNSIQSAKQYPINQLAQTQYIEQLKNPAQRENQKSLIVNQDISQVKYRLDQLMSRFPIQSFQTGKKNPHFNNNIQIPQELSAPHLNMRRTNSINQNSTLNLQQRQNGGEFKRNPHTEGKIFISDDNKKPSYGRRVKYGSEELIAKDNTQSKGGYSLNYSESGINSIAEVNIPKPSVENLYQHIRQQEETIQTYKQIISRLEDQNAHLLSIIQTQSKPIQPNPSQSLNSISNHQSIHPIHSQNYRSINNLDSEHKNSHLSDSFHKFETEQSNHSQLRNSHSQNFQPHSSLDKRPRIKSSSKITPSLQQKVDILESQKTELLNKIDWLNGIVQEMMNMANKPKNQNSAIEDNQSSYSYSKKSNLSGDLRKASKVIQTSFVQYVPPLNSEHLSYKELYEQQIEHKKSMKNQINDLLQLQNAYSGQFQLILKEINEIKRNRAYYQELKREIQKSKEKSLNKQQNGPRSRSPLLKQDSKKTAKKIFENQVIYQLKSENEHLLSKYLKLKQLYVKQKAAENNLNLSTNNLNISDRTIQPGESLIASTEKNFFEQNKFKKKQKVQKRNQIIFEGKGERQRPASYTNFNIPLPRLSADSRMRSFDNRKNGTIYLSSQFLDSKKSRKRLIQQNLLNQEVSKINEEVSKFNQGVSGFNQEVSRKDLSITPHKNGDSRLKQRNQEDEVRPRMTDKFQEQRRSAVSHEILEQKEKQSRWRNEQRQNMIGRYNSFIKNMKKRFGINSSIIGRQISANNDSLSYE